MTDDGQGQDSQRADSIVLGTVRISKIHDYTSPLADHVMFWDLGRKREGFHTYFESGPNLLRLLTFRSPTPPPCRRRSRSCRRRDASECFYWRQSATHGYGWKDGQLLWQ